MTFSCHISYLGQLCFGLVDVRSPLRHQAHVFLLVDGGAAERAKIGHLMTVIFILDSFSVLLYKVRKVA